MIEIFDGCTRLVKEGKFPTNCEKCHEKIRTVGSLFDHYHDEHHDNMDVNMFKRMVGGNDISNESDEESLELPELFNNVSNGSDDSSFESPELSFVPFDDIDFSHRKYILKNIKPNETINNYTINAQNASFNY